MKSIKLLAATGLAVASFGATAGLLNVVGGADYVIPSNNDLLYDGGLTSYNVGGDLYFDTNAPLDITFSFFGKEAGWNSEFNAYGNTLLNTDAVGSSFTVNDVVTTTNGGLVDFDFEVLTGNAAGSVITNGANQPWNSPQSFAVLLDYTYGGILYDELLGSYR